MDPINWTGLPTIDLFSERIDKIRGKTHITSSRYSACKLNTVERSKGLMTFPMSASLSHNSKLSYRAALSSFTNFCDLYSLTTGANISMQNIILFIAYHAYKNFFRTGYDIYVFFIAKQLWQAVII